MLSLSELIVLFVLAGIGAMFWQLRTISEGARFHAERQCRQRRLQLLNVARTGAKLGKVTGQGIGWHCQYQCEFSTDGINQLHATLTMEGKLLKDITFPFYPEPEWQQAPDSRGRIGMGGCGGGGRSSCGSKGGCR